MIEYANMSSTSSISIAISDAHIEPGQKMRLIVSILPPPGWKLISQNAQEVVYERSGPSGQGGSINFQIRAFTTTEKS
jgi:hypothetical protein